jgi:hypothetical protein
MDKDKPPRKPRKKQKLKASTETPAPTPQVTSSKLTPLTPEENQQFLNQINNFLKKKQTSNRESAEDYKILQTNISEFLESFITFGYTFNGQRIVIQHYPTPRDRDALLEFLKNIFIANTAKDISFLEGDE